MYPLPSLKEANDMRRLLPTFLVLLSIGTLARPAHCQNRGGFTLLLSMGYGLQNGAVGEGTSEGLDGLNLGIGGFVSKDVALMFRISGTSVTHDNPPGYGQTDVISGVAAFDVQWWASERLNFEFGGGLGLLSIGSYDSQGLGLLACVGYSVLLRGKYSLQIGIEDALMFNDDYSVQNVGFNLGFQFL
jgi:hypothetical protein